MVGYKLSLSRPPRRYHKKTSVPNVVIAVGSILGRARDGGGMWGGERFAIVWGGERKTFRRPLKMTLAVKVVKIDSKVIILLSLSKSVKQTVYIEVLNHRP